MKKSLLICYPCYDGMCNVKSMEAIMGTVVLCTASDIQCEFFPLTSESLISRGRNVCIGRFLNSKCSHMMFIDSDIVFHPKDVLKMLQNDCGVICGNYPKKMFKTSELDCENVIPDEAMTQVEGEIHVSKYAPTGFMMIKRETIQRLIEDNPDKKYRNDISGYKMHTIGLNEFYNLFPIGVEGNRYVSEDYGFCILCDESKIDVYIDKSIKLYHIGRYIFGKSHIKTSD